MNKNKSYLGNKQYLTNLFSVVLLIIALTGIVFFNNRLIMGDGITGNVILQNVDVRSDFKYAEPENLSMESALNALILSENDLNEMLSSNLTVYFINDTLLNAKTAFIGLDIEKIKQSAKKETGEKKKTYLESLYLLGQKIPYEMRVPLNYPNVFRLTQLISFTKYQSFRIVDTIFLLEKRINDYTALGINVSDGRDYLNAGKKSFKEERYDEAEAYLKEASIKLDQTYSEKTRSQFAIEITRTFLEKYWIWVVIIIAILLILISPATKKIQKADAKRKLKKLKLELEALNESLKQAQKDYFSGKTITEGTYKMRSDNYKSRIGEIKHTIPVLEAIVSGKKGTKEEEQKMRGLLKIK